MSTSRDNRPTRAQRRAASDARAAARRAREEAAPTPGAMGPTSGVSDISGTEPAGTQTPNPFAPPMGNPPQPTAATHSVGHGFVDAYGADQHVSRPFEEEVPGWTLRDTGVACAISLAMVMWTIVAVWAGAPILGRSWSWWGLVGVAGAALTLWGVGPWFQKRQRPGLTSALAPVAVLVVLLGAFFYGVNNSVVIRGRIYANNSTEARSYHLAQELLADREYYAQVDRLLGMDAAEARARFKEFEPAQKRMEAISDRWSRQSIDTLPDGDFVPVMESARAAAYFGAQALDRKQSLFGAQDQRVAAELDAFRKTFIDNSLAMGPQLKSLADRYGFSLGASSPGE